MHKPFPLFIAIFLILSAACLPACHLEPEVAGANVFNTLTLDRGEQFQITLPADKQQNPAWRIDSYDSSKLQMVSPVELVSEGGATHFQATLRAGAPGTTQIVFRRLIEAIGDRVKKYTIKVRE